MLVILFGIAWIEDSIAGCLFMEYTSCESIKGWGEKIASSGLASLGLAQQTPPRGHERSNIQLMNEVKIWTNKQRLAWPVRAHAKCTKSIIMKLETLKQEKRRCVICVAMSIKQMACAIAVVSN